MVGGGVGVLYTRENNRSDADGLNFQRQKRTR